jgi:hypothetical protein
MDITGGLAAASSALGIAKSLRDVEKSYDAATYRAKIADLMEALTDTRLALVEAKEDLAGKNSEIERLKMTAIDRSALIEGAGGYKYRANEQGRHDGFPVCPKCDEVDGRLIYLVQNKLVDAAKCPACANEYQPVTCYFPDGSTLVSKRDEGRRQVQAKQNRAMAEFGRNTPIY